eukprot:6670064-Lingulodinium_polyedra.AAC.1
MAGLACQRMRRTHREGGNLGAFGADEDLQRAGLREHGVNVVAPAGPHVLLRGGLPTPNEERAPKVAPVGGRDHDPVGANA